MGELLLKTVGLTKHFGQFVALNDVDIEIHAGRVLGLVGSNGAGKSTMIKALTGAHAPTSGTISVSGDIIPKPDPSLMRQLGVSCIYQHSSLVPTLTLLENIFLGREIKNKFGLIDKTAQRIQLDKLMTEYGINLDPNVLVSELGAVAQKEAEILKALFGNASIILMDEPTAWLSHFEVANLHKTIHKLIDRNKGVVYISHVLDEVFDISDHITILRDGNVSWSGETKDIDRPTLIDYMVGQEIGTESRKASTIERRPRGNGDIRLSCKNLTREPLFRDISFDLYAGEILCFSGLIGSKRTELTKALFGLDKLDSGSIEIDGKKVDIFSPRDAIEQGLVYVPEDRHAEGLVLDHTIEENIALTSLDALSKGSFINRTDMIDLSQRHISGLNIQPPNRDKQLLRMSGGNQQKVMLAKWLELSPKILILDEPTVGVDVGAKAEIYAQIKSMRDNGTAVIVVSSDIEEINNVYDRILVFKTGGIVHEFDEENISQAELVRKMG